MQPHVSLWLWKLAVTFSPCSSVSSALPSPSALPWQPPAEVQGREWRCKCWVINMHLDSNISQYDIYISYSLDSAFILMLYIKSPKWLIINLGENITVCVPDRRIQRDIKPCDCALNKYSISCEGLCVQMTELQFIILEKKKVCGWHKMTYLTAPGSVVDNQRLSDNAECNLPSPCEVWHEKLVCIALTV